MRQLRRCCQPCLRNIGVQDRRPIRVSRMGVFHQISRVVVIIEAGQFSRYCRPSVPAKLGQMPAEGEGGRAASRSTPEPDIVPAGLPPFASQKLEARDQTATFVKARTFQKDELRNFIIACVVYCLGRIGLPVFLETTAAATSPPVGCEHTLARFQSSATIRCPFLGKDGRNAGSALPRMVVSWCFTANSCCMRVGPGCWHRGCTIRRASIGCRGGSYFLTLT